MKKCEISRESQPGPASEAADVVKHIDRLQSSEFDWRRHQAAASLRASLIRREAKSTAKAVSATQTAARAEKAD